jgi:hypothetical protein
MLQVHGCSFQNCVFRLCSSSDWSCHVKCVSLVVMVNVNVQCLVYIGHIDSMYLVI